MKTDEELGGPWHDALPAEAPVVHRNLKIRVNATNLTTLTYDHLNYWLSKLHITQGGPFMIVARGGEAPFIQTYRHSRTEYSLEVRSGIDGSDYLAVTVDDVTVVAQLIWSWLENDSQRLDTVAWEQRTWS
ncbi:hypothetical protein AB0F85_09530 [Nocardia fluminea]|uniref:hypothetical protein n=1 Tax=Nocardia fluminea TaxID=134984 RepID=UPI00340E8324